MTMELYRGGLASSLELIYAQLNTLTARIDLVGIKADLLKSSVALIRALGGGWNRKQLPNDDQIQPFDTFQYVNRSLLGESMSMRPTTGRITI